MSRIPLPVAAARTWLRVTPVPGGEVGDCLSVSSRRSERLLPLLPLADAFFFFFFELRVYCHPTLHCVTWTGALYPTNVPMILYVTWPEQGHTLRKVASCSPGGSRCLVPLMGTWEWGVSKALSR